MDIYRIKVTKCLDLVYRGSCRDLVEYLSRIITVCGEDSKIYIHVLKASGEAFESSEPICTLTIKEALHGMLQQCCQP